MVQQIAMEREEYQRGPRWVRRTALWHILPSRPRDATRPHTSPQSAAAGGAESVSVHKCGRKRAPGGRVGPALRKLRKSRPSWSGRALQVDTQREGTLVSLTRVGPRASGLWEPSCSLPLSRPCPSRSAPHRMVSFRSAQR